MSHVCSIWLAQRPQVEDCTLNLETYLEYLNSVLLTQEQKNCKYSFLHRETTELSKIKLLNSNWFKR
jgi:hypothetical protein